MVGVGLSVLLGLTMLVEEVRDSSLVWLFLPIMALPFVLLIYHHRMRQQPGATRTGSVKRKGQAAFSADRDRPQC